MKKQFFVKRFLAFLLMLAMVFGSLPGMALAEKISFFGTEAPTALTVTCESDRQIDGKLFGKKGDTFQFKAVDQNGDETPVDWSTSSTWLGTLNEDGVFTVTDDFTFGNSSSICVKAVSKLDSAVSKEINCSLAGYLFNSYQKNQTVNLSADGQTAKTVSFSGGVGGHNVWDYKEALDSGIVTLSADPGNSGSVKFNALRPGTFNVGFKLDMDENISDTATVTIKGVAVEDAENNQGKTYLNITESNSAPTVQLQAYAEADRSIASWSSSNEAVASVDESGLVTAKSAGTALITAVDSEGDKGGIKVVVSNDAFPSFEALEFYVSAFTSGTWVTGQTYQPAVTEYDLPIRAYGTAKLTLQDTTLYDTEKYNAVAEYTDINGEKQAVKINSGKTTYLDNIPFDESSVKIILTDKTNPGLKTVYTFNVTRPRDTSKAIKFKGIVMEPDGRGLLPAKYNGQPEGTMFKADENGVLTSGNGVSSSQYNYRTFALDGLEKFTLNFTANTAYQHLRYSADGGQTWKELPQGGGATDKLTFPAEGDKVVKVQVQILDDKTYSDNVKAGKDGFADAETTDYNVWVEQVGNSSASAQILTAESESGDWYAPFQKDIYSYTVVVPNDTAVFPTVKYTVSEGAKVTLGSTEQTADANGVYSLKLKTMSQTLTVSSADGAITNSYAFKAAEKTKYDVPDKVVDYLCINSQYTNGGAYGTAPEATLSGSMKSLGGFGGYITYYYDVPLTDNPGNKYGVDFYVYGNANVDTSSSTGMSFFEPGQVWVSEDGEKWYALAGSAHYEDGVDWNYTVAYTKAANGKTAWTDNYGNSNNGSSFTGMWADKNLYYMNNILGTNAVTLSGVMLPAANGSAAVSGTAVDAYAVNWGYADAFANGTLGDDVNPYLDNSDHKHKTNGFDLAWAVDAEGNPVDVSAKSFHYVKVQTASNIWHPTFCEKSTEVNSVVRTVAQEEAVGKTAAPSGVTISDGISSKQINFTDNQQIYSVDLGSMKYVKLTVNGTAAEDNIYINNQRVASGTAAEGIKVTKESGEKLVRIISQNGEKEPAVYLLKLTGSAVESDEIIEGINVGAGGSARQAATTDGIGYRLTVGHRIDTVEIAPIVEAGVEYTVNGKPAEDGYKLEYGKNVFEIAASAADGKNQTVTLTVTREKAPESSGKNITVRFTLFGDDNHGDNGEIHTLKNGNLETWIEKTSYTVPAEYTVLDVLDKALGEKGWDYVNADGNYISEIRGLGEFDNGPNSGWMYTVNGKHSEKGVAEQGLKDGDRIVFHYTDDYNVEEGSDKWSGGGSDTTATVDDVIKLINDIGTVTKDSGDKIKAARTAYDKLSDKDKAK
ncbi:MAG: DUF4430 domain-containing protein, partial [Bacillota bacterium]